MKRLIEKLVTISSPSGREHAVREVIAGEIKPYVDEMKIDPLGNLVALKKGKSGRKLLFDGHMDEIGVVVTHVDSKGFLRVDSIGGLSPYMLLGSRLIFETGASGIVDVEGETVKDFGEAMKSLDYDHIFVDIGATDKGDAEKKAPVGTFGTYDSTFVDLGKRLVSKSMDDRIACAIMIQVVKELEQPEDDVYFVFAVQEEVGIVGASVAAFDIMPDMAVAIDVTAGPDTPKSFKRMGFKLGGGPTIKIKDRGSISSSRVVTRLKEVAEKRDIPTQYEVLIFGGTDARGYQTTGRGIASGTVSIPCRYVHSPHEMVDYDDVLNAVRLLKALAEEGVE
ncbi:MULTISPECIES: M42 family metallopeptidase [unclassified Mesotoga]|uniref:M42 family metallopeptidase n=3 Tax=Mesotoga TaxID=1184396 RepID=UPI000EF24406|nr:MULTISPECIES: M20/M25/M40 family metallo-hydrolase [unclassified Mesotoga]MDI9369069.1 M20/M25/M40 family metallo-hydrolase [Thermotogota bacterium]NLT45480.1 M42 family metallopeptidase [Thermotogaceae bacterium]MDD3681165.1 M20/M25/M40 family metallo-hydrolase [Mesotoga sp.]MDD4206418.1 M20/M25/M40 family metallo-hydrolase [Mesotoga sp.]MDD4825456.1 M20/M25/M40 family metallo-hydrolase [Mesotoga sp.]